MKRKIYNKLVQWKHERNGTSALLIEGARRIGKSYIAEEFARNEYESYILIDFSKSPARVKSWFDDYLEDVDTLLQNIQLHYKKTLTPRKSLIIFDEVQKCPRAREAIKALVADHRFDYLETGSLISIKKNVEDIVIPSEEESLDMYPMDFEEFLWAQGIPDEVIGKFTSCLEELKPIPESIHERMFQLLLQYTIIGGMPAVVENFTQNKNVALSLSMQRNLLRSYEDDMVKYASASDKSIIRECFRSIPKQLGKENKKFQYSVVRKGTTASRFRGALQWIEDAGIIRRCHNLSITGLPLDGNAIPDIFKVYMSDTGLFVAMLEDGTQSDILQGNLSGYKGAIFENLVADMLGKQGRKLYYFHKNSGLEVDFVIRMQGQCVLMEVKATTGNTKSSKTILAHPEKYGIAHCIKFGRYNIGRTGGIITMPLYAAAFLSSVQIPDV